MFIKRQIVLKAVVTPQLKEELAESFNEGITRVQEEQDELDRQSRRMMLELQRTDMSRAMAFRQQLEAEKRKREDVKAALQEQLAQSQELELGIELTRGTLEGYVEIAVGDNLEEKLGMAEILVEDGVVKAIRDPAEA